MRYSFVCLGYEMSGSRYDKLLETRYIFTPVIVQDEGKVRL
jgi:hypothetical protein